MKIWNKLTSKYTVLIFLLAFLSGTVGGYYQYSRELKRQKKTIDEEITQLLKLIITPAALSAYSIDSTLARRITDGLTAGKQFSYAEIGDDFGEILAKSSRPSPKSGPSIRLTPRLADRLLPYDSLSIPLRIENGMHVGYLYVEIDKKEIIRGFQSQQRSLLIGFIFLGLIIILSLTVLFYLWIIRPVLSLNETLKKTDVKNFTGKALPAPVLHKKDEIGELVRTIQSLLGEFATSIDKNRKAEEALMKSLSEKEVLLKEVHHRVKNNLQIISSLLRLQSTGLQDLEDRELFTECQNRISAMALVHQELYENETLSVIAMNDYIPKLIESLASIYRSAEETRISMEIDNFVLDISTAINTALILNELISNAFKYGKPSRGNRIFHIEAHRREGMIRIKVADNGPGLPEGKALDAYDSLGLQLVTHLTTQVEGEIQYRNNQGAEFILAFPHEESR